MPNKLSVLTDTLLICITILLALWIVRDSLCELRYKDGPREFSASFVYEMK